MRIMNVLKRTRLLALAIVVFGLLSFAREAKADTYSEIMLFGGQTQCNPRNGCLPPWGSRWTDCLDSTSGTVESVACSGATSQQWSVTYGGQDSYGFPYQVISQGSNYLTNDGNGHVIMAQCGYPNGPFPGCTPGAQQQWELLDGTLYSTYQQGWCMYPNGSASGSTLTVSGGCYGTDQTDLVWLTTLSGGNDPMWFRTGHGGGADPGVCLDTDGFGLYTATCQSTSSVEFYLTNEHQICNGDGTCLGYNSGSNVAHFVAPGTSGYDFTWWILASGDSLAVQIANPDYSVCVQNDGNSQAGVGSCGTSSALWFPLAGYWKKT